MRWLLGRMIYGLVRILHMSYRYRHVGVENLQAARDRVRGGCYLLGVWHENVLPGILAQTGGTYVVIVSRSKDAEPVALTCSRMGHYVCRGSSKRGDVYKGGREAKEEMIGFLKEGFPGAVTVDGPTGPAKEVKPGIIEMARESGAVLVPYVVVADNYWTLNTWDRFRLPKPLCRIVVYYGEPFPVPAETERERFSEFQDELAKRLEKGEEEARTRFADWKELGHSRTPAVAWKRPV